MNTLVKNISKGIVISFLITIFGIFLFSIILAYSNISESIIPTAIIMITSISIFISSFFCIRKMNKNGLLNGALIGGIYVILLYTISSIVNKGFNLNIHSAILMGLGIVSGIIGRNNWYKYKVKC